MRRMMFWRHGPSALVAVAVTSLAVVLIAGCGSSSTSRNAQMLQSVGKSEGQLNLVAAARDAGVERFVYVSYSRHLDDDGPLTHAKRTVEKALAASEMTYVILRPTYFMEVWLPKKCFPRARLLGGYRNEHVLDLLTVSLWCAAWPLAVVLTKMWAAGGVLTLAEELSQPQEGAS